MSISTCCDIHKDVFNSHSDSIRLPTLVQVGKNLIIASFPLMKLLPAKYVLEKAVREKLIKKGDIVVETSSGTYALGLSLMCVELGLSCYIVSDPVIDQDLFLQLKHLKCEVQIVEDPQGAHQVARLNALKEFLSQHPHAFWPQQYDNPDHLYAYSDFAEQLIQSLGEELILIASVGSGSSSCGTMMHLRKYNPSIPLIGVDTFGSILFGLQNRKRALRGLGNSILPKNLIHSLFDQIHWVSASQAFHLTQEFYSVFGSYVGPTTGACYQVAQWIAKQYPKKKVVFISPDKGYRYTSTIYNDEWMRTQGFMQRVDSPIKVSSLKEINQGSFDWAYLDWNRSSLDHVLGSCK